MYWIIIYHCIIELYNCNHWMIQKISQNESCAKSHWTRKEKVDSNWIIPINCEFKFSPHHRVDRQKLKTPVTNQNVTPVVSRWTLLFGFILHEPASNQHNSRTVSCRNYHTRPGNKPANFGVLQSQRRPPTAFHI